MWKNYYVFVWGVKKHCANIGNEVCVEIKVIDACLKVKFPSFLPSKYIYHDSFIFSVICLFFAIF